MPLNTHFEIKTHKSFSIQAFNSKRLIFDTNIIDDINNNLLEYFYKSSSCHNQPITKRFIAVDGSITN